MNPTDQFVIKHLEDVHAIELALVQTLTAHIGVTPEGEYRSILERHLRETNDQAQAIRERLGALGATKSPVDVVRTLVTTLVGQALAGAKAPVDLLRGPSGEEKILRNARDECATEALEIAAYDALEAIATAAGDQKTATLAREHRTQEEVTLKQLREVIPQLARDAFAAEAKGEMSYKVSETGAAQAVKGATRDARGRLSDVGQEARERLQKAGDEGDDVLEGYDRLTAQQALDLIDGLEGEDLGRVEAFERTHRNRKRVLDRLAARRRDVVGA